MFSSARAAKTSFFDWAAGQLAPVTLSSSGATLDPDRRQLIEAIICTLDRLAADAATVTSGVNTLRAPDGSLKPREIQKFLPATDHKLTELLQALEDETDATPLLAASGTFISVLEEGCRTVHAFADEETSLGRERVRILYGARLARIWRHACGLAIELIDATNADMRFVLPLAYRQNAAVLTSLLSGAANGLCPCLDESRHLYLPQLPQQRRWLRRSVLQTCTVEWNGKSVDAFIHDASAGGLGLGKLPRLARNTPLKVTTESGRMFNCVVAWANDERVGVKFPLLLSQDDPLISG